MEAKGHEEIEEHMAAFLKLLIYIVGHSKGFDNPYSKSVFNRFYSDLNKDTVARSFYVGNWLTDNSQLFAPDFFFDFQYNLPQNIEKIEHALSVAKEQTESILNQISASVPQFLIGDAIDTINAWVASVLGKSITYAYELKTKAKVEKPIPDNFEFDKRDECWLFALSLLKLMGYNKFCRNKKNPISEDLFIKIVHSFIDEKKNPKTYKFKLNFYYPSDHLDRAFLSRYVGSEKDKQKRANQWKKSQNIDGITSKKLKREKVKVYEDMGSLRRNCYDDDAPEQSCYKYLNDYIEILGTKLNHLNAHFIKPHILEGKNRNPDNFYIYCAQLGHSLHGVEDFFAHSNYTELVANSLDKIKEQMDNPELYYSQKDFFKLLSTDEKNRYKRANNKTVRDINERNTDIVEEINLTTGIFAENDTFTSMYHLIFGTLEEKVDEMIDDKNIIDDPFIAMIQYFLESFTEYIEIYDSLERKWQIASGQERKFSIKIIKFIINRNEDPDKQVNTGGLLKSIDNKLLEYWVEVLNKLAQVAAAMKLAGTAPLLLLKFIQTILMTIFLPLIMVLFVKRALSAFAKNEFAKSGLKLAVDLCRENAANWIESNVLELNRPMMYGSHSNLAKDESFRNFNWNWQAKRMALFMDQFILLNMVVGTDVKENKQVDMVALLRKYLRHPCPDNSKKEEQIKNELELYGTEANVELIDISTKQMTKATLAEIWNKGAANIIKSISPQKYKARFLELNGEYIKEEYLEKEKARSLKMSDIKVKDYKPFTRIVFPFQKSEINYYSNNNIIRRQMSPKREIVVTAQAQIDNKKMWMMQFFNIKDYKMFESKKPLEILAAMVNDVDPQMVQTYSEKFAIRFNEDEESVSLIEDTPKISCDSVLGIREFEIENDMKKEYEKFTTAFIKAHYLE